MPYQKDPDSTLPAPWLPLLAPWTMRIGVAGYAGFLHARVVGHGIKPSGACLKVQIGAFVRVLFSLH